MKAIRNSENEEWISVMTEELVSLNKNRTWKQIFDNNLNFTKKKKSNLGCIDLPKEKKAIVCDFQKETKSV